MPGVAAEGVDRYLSLLRAGGSDYPMKLLAQAGVDLGQPDTVQAVATELDALVARLERELGVRAEATGQLRQTGLDVRRRRCI